MKKAYRLGYLIIALCAAILGLITYLSSKKCKEENAEE